MRLRAKTRGECRGKTGSREHYEDRATGDAIPKASAMGNHDNDVEQDRESAGGIQLPRALGGDGKSKIEEGKTISGPKMEMGVEIGGWTVIKCMRLVSILTHRAAHVGGSHLPTQQCQETEDNRYMAAHAAVAEYNNRPLCLVTSSAVLCIRSLLPPHLFFQLGTVCDSVAQSATDGTTLQKTAFTSSRVLDRE